MSFNFNSYKPATYQNNQGVQRSTTTTSTAPQKTRLTKKYTLQGFAITDIVWMRPSEGRHKYEVLVRYIDPEAQRTKRNDGSYQKIIKFGQKGVNDYVDVPHMVNIRDRVHARLKMNCDNPLHQNFYVKNVLNGPNTDAFDNFRILKKNIFS